MVNLLRVMPTQPLLLALWTFFTDLVESALERISSFSSPSASSDEIFLEPSRFLSLCSRAVAKTGDVDSKLKSTDIGFPNSNFGTMQTEGSPIRPKYYLSTKKYGQLVNLLEQGRDGKTTQDVIVTPGARLLDTLTGGSLESPVNTIFVTGSISGNGVSFSRSNPVDSVNKTINSVLTGAFYDRP
jgi:hypothetical protein